MNLKTAAKRLGVHYQTAYRYVRSGQLVAVRVGTGYEVSEAAVDMLVARLAARDALPDKAPVLNDAERLSFEAELEILVAECTLSAQPVFDFVTRELATVVGEMAVLYLLSEGGTTLHPVSAFDTDPRRRALRDALHASSDVTVADFGGLEPILAGRTANVHHVDLDEAVRVLPSRFREHADRLMIQSVVVTSVVAHSGQPLGILMVGRHHGGVPFADEVVTWVEAAAHRVAAAAEHVDRFCAGWAAREDAVAAFSAAVRDAPGLDRSDPRELSELLGSAVAEAVFDSTRVLLAANEPFLRRFAPRGTTATRLVGHPVPALQVVVDEVWPRLLSGAVDFLTTEMAAVGRDGDHEHVHWAVIRRPDASPVWIVATWEPLDPI